MKLSDKRNFATEGADPPPAGPATGFSRLERAQQRRVIRQGRRSLGDPVLRGPLRAAPDILKARRRNARKVRKAFVTSRVHKQPFELFKSEALARSMPTSAMILGTQEGPAGDFLSPP